MSRTEISQARDLIAGLQREDPRLYNALLLMADSIEGLSDILEPLIKRSEAANATVAIPLAPTGLTAEIYPAVVELNWTVAAGATEYELRESTQEGGVWDTADFIERTTAVRTVLDPLLVGTHTFLLKSINSLGQPSVDFAIVVVVIPAISSVTVTTQVIDNNVLLYWTLPTSVFQIDHYRVERNHVLFGESRSTFFSMFETVAGDYTYSITAVDIAGNLGQESTVTVHVNAPPDFELQASRVSDLTGTRTNVLLRDGRLLACIAAESWQAHFTSRAWLTPRNQWDAGFHLYIEPTANAGSYREVFDFGSVFTNVIVNVDWAYRNLGSVPIGVGCQIESSLDNANWSAPVNAQSAFFQQVRYVRMTLNFTGAGGLSLAEIWNIRILLDVKQEVDSGLCAASSADIDGTVVNFAKVFKDINSITLAPRSLEPLEAIYIFTDAPNPTSFKIMVFDSAGSRVNADVSWKARGIV